MMSLCWVASSCVECGCTVVDAATRGIAVGAVGSIVVGELIVVRVDGGCVGDGIVAWSVDDVLLVFVVLMLLLVLVVLLLWLVLVRWCCCRCCCCCCC